MRALVLLLAIFTGLSFAAHADDDVATARTVITSQAEAFGRDAAAFAYASPALKQIFQQPAMFMAMVRSRYAPVYRHKSFEFGDGKIENGKITQNVHIRDDNGELWEAMYTLERQPDGSLKITGCVLLKTIGA